MYSDPTPSLGLRFKVHMHGHCCDYVVYASCTAYTLSCNLTACSSLGQL